MRKFGSNLLGFEILNFGSRNADTLVVSRVLGAAPLAQYSLSYRTMMLPVQNLAWLISRVAFPHYARYQDEPAVIGRHFLRMTRLIAMISFPSMMLVIVLAPTAIPFLFGPAWEPAVFPMQILALTGARQSIHSLTGPVFMATGRTDYQFRFQLLATAACVTAFIVGVRWGIAGVAVAYTVTGLVLSPLEIGLIGKLARFGTVDYLQSFTPAAVAGLFAAGASWLVTSALQSLGSPLLVLLITPLAGLASFLAAVRLLAPAQLKDAREAFVLLVPRRSVRRDAAAMDCQGKALEQCA